MISSTSRALRAFTASAAATSFGFEWTTALLPSSAPSEVFVAQDQTNEAARKATTRAAVMAFMPSK
jgi:hypothetical protein